MLCHAWDFNARVGSRAVDDDEWWYESGPHRYGELNEASRDLLSFLSTNEATVPQVTQVALYRLHNNEEGTPEEMPGCVCEVRGKL